MEIIILLKDQPKNLIKNSKDLTKNNSKTII